MKSNKTAQRADDPEFEAPKEKKQYSSSKMQIVEEYLSIKYEFRFNEIKCKPEVRNLALSEKRFRPVDKYILNSLNRELDCSNIKTSTAAIKELIESDFAQKVNPIQEYFKKLPTPEPGQDYIRQLADTVKVVNSDKWNEYLTKWLVAVIANAMSNVGCQNHTCLVLTGGQGKFKTTWLDNLCPKELTNYIFTGKIDPTNKDSLTYIAEFLFINIDDQLKQLNKKDENELKNLITTPSVKYRRPYDPYIVEYPHTASFMASVNGNDFLTDPTGSRRFLPFEVVEIDINKAKALDMNKVYAQAFSLFKKGFRYYFTDEEIQELHENNKNFQVITNEEQLIQEYFDIPSDRSKATMHLPGAMIQSFLEIKTRQKLSSKKIGEALSHLGCEKWQKTSKGKTTWVYSVIQKTDEEILRAQAKMGDELEEDPPF